MIEEIKAKTILDSREKPTVEVEVKTQAGVFSASCPAGASTGETEAKVVDSKEAVNNVNEIIAPKLLGENEKNQKRIDSLMIKLDGTKNKEKLGANAILPVSIACCRAGAGDKPLFKHIGRGSVLPRPCFNIINGGVHAKNNLDIQEFMVVPGYQGFAKNFQAGKKVFNNLKVLLKKKFGPGGIVMGDEGGFAPPISDPSEALDFIVKSIGKLKVDIGLDVAATRLKKKYDPDYYLELVNKYPIIFIEDPFPEKDSQGFQKITEKIGQKVIIVGDDFLTTNIERIKKERHSCNGIIIKPNQIGTVTETLEAVKLAKSYKWKTIVSHRSGETMDDFIADLAVGVNADFIKSGAPSKKERLAKYNRLVKIEQYG